MPKKKKSFEESLVRLEELVNHLEKGELPLEESLNLFAEGITLVGDCNKQLDTAEKRIQMLVNNEAGEPVLQELAEENKGGLLD